MNNIRIISNNVADSATLTGSGTGIENLKMDTKSAVWRTIGNVAYVIAVPSSVVTINGIIFPFTNLTASAIATVVAKLDGTVVYSRSGIQVCAYTPLTLFEWGISPLGENAYNQSEYSGVNSFSGGEGSYGAIWLDTVVADRIEVTVTDSGNIFGFIDISRLIIGQSWSPKYNPDYGVEVTQEDNSKSYRTDAGDLKIDAGVKYKKISLDISHMPPEDRTDMWNILKKSGISRPLFISVFPETTLNPTLEQTYQVYGKLSSASALSATYYNRFATKIEIEEN
jgi:hypothetical protein